MPDPAIATRADEADLLVPVRRRRGLRWTLSGVGVAMIVTFTVVAWNRFGTDPTLVDSPLIGQRAPEFSLPSLDGGRLSNADISGRAYVVNFWASWCVPCRQEAPELERFARSWSTRGVQVVGIVYNDREDKAQEFRTEFGLSYPQVMDPDGRAAIDFGVFGVPETFVVDQRGVVMAKLIGAVGPGVLDQVLTQILAGETYSSENDDYRTSPG